MLYKVSGDDVAAVIEAADTFQAIVILLLLGFFALAWKYGREILLLMRDASETTEKIDNSLQTNHGSENIGKAMDRQYEMLLDLQVTRDIDAKRAKERYDRLERQLSSVRETFTTYKAEMEPLVEFGRERMQKLLEDESER